MTFISIGSCWHAVAVRNNETVSAATEISENRRLRRSWQRNATERNISAEHQIHSNTVNRNISGMLPDEIIARPSWPHFTAILEHIILTHTKEQNHARCKCTINKKSNCLRLCQRLGWNRIPNKNLVVLNMIRGSCARYSLPRMYYITNTVISTCTFFILKQKYYY